MLSVKKLTPQQILDQGTDPRKGHIKLAMATKITKNNINVPEEKKMAAIKQAFAFLKK